MGFFFSSPTITARGGGYGNSQPGGSGAGGNYEGGAAGSGTQGNSGGGTGYGYGGGAQGGAGDLGTGSYFGGGGMWASDEWTTQPGTEGIQYDCATQGPSYNMQGECIACCDDSSGGGDYSLDPDVNTDCVDMYNKLVV